MAFDRTAKNWKGVPVRRSLPAQKGKIDISSWTPPGPKNFVSEDWKHDGAAPKPVLDRSQAPGGYPPPLPRAEGGRVQARLDRKSGGGIHIKPQNRGLLHRKLGVPEGEKIPEGKIDAAKARAKRTGNTTLMKETTFAQNFGGKG